MKPEFVALPPQLKVRDLALHAGGMRRGRVLCTALSMLCKPAQRWVLLGPNGAGKSTLLSTLAGLMPVVVGQVQLAERTLQAYTATELARLRAWCPQFWLDPFPLSAWEAVACAITATRPALAGSAVEALALEWLDAFDVAMLRDTDVRVLSGGERQRIALATACAQAAPLLLLDEPTAHLDWAHQSLFVARMRAWSDAGGLVLAAVHDLNLAWALATHVLLLDGRGGVCSGTREEVMQAGILSAAYGVPVSVQQSDEGPGFRIRFEGGAEA